MDQFDIQGPSSLMGSVAISRSKNSSLPLLAAVLLNPYDVVIRELPELRDIKTILKLLTNLGVKVHQKGTEWTLNAGSIHTFEANYELVKTMRASILVLGPLLARFKMAKVSLPGGCAIGTRPIDIHLMGLEKMGAQITITEGYVEAKTGPAGLQAAHIVLPFPSVGATEHLMMAATLAEGKTILENVAKEPEIDDLARFLRAMGAKLEGEGTNRIVITGVEELKPVASYRPIADRIEAATFIMAALITGSAITLTDCCPDHIRAILEVLGRMGARFEENGETLKVHSVTRLSGIEIDTAPYPGFPTDVQAQLLALLTLSDGPSVVTEHIFENRFMHVPELNRLGANILLKGNSAYVKGVKELKGAPVMCTDLRASAALVLAGLAAKGTTTVQRVYHIDRGYEKIDEKLVKLGARIKRANLDR